MTMTGTIARLLCLTSVLAAPSAWAGSDASPFGSRHQLVISSERLFGFVHSKETTSAAGFESSTSWNSVSLFGNPVAFTSRYATPRLALDGFLAERFSLGAAASFFSATRSSSSTQTSQPDFSGFLLAPRFGFAMALSPRVALWPRMGFTYVRLRQDSSGGEMLTNSVYAFTAEVPFVFTLVDHLFAGVAATLDLGIGGSSSQSGIGAGVNVKPKETAYGVVTTLGGYF